MLHFHLFVASLNSNSHGEYIFYLKTTQSALHAVQALSYYQLVPMDHNIVQSATKDK